MQAKDELMVLPNRESRRRKHRHNGSRELTEDEIAKRRKRNAIAKESRRRNR